MTLRYVDPPDCGCTDCILGDAIPLDRAGPSEIAQLMSGKLISHLDKGTEITIKLSITLMAEDLQDASTTEDLADVIAHAQRTEITIHEYSFDI